jgi:light-regulated signal transduction histidine kinase (bacteriophytochrome)
MNSNRNYRRDGSIIHCDWYNSAIYDEQGRLASILSFVLDTTEHKRASDEIRALNEQLERRVRERTAELEEINRELESFSYSVSHDLRAPLRSIDGFSLALYEEYLDRLDETGKDYLMRVRTATRHMERLIDDLLNLSRVSRADMLFNATDLSRIAADILETLGRENPDRKVEIFIQENIVASGDPSLIRIVLENILSNAWKFTARNRQARIEFGCTEMNGEYVYYIRDNGVGFDMAYAGKLFGTFQRLHGKDDFPGTGVGLAIVQRIIHRHGGRVWAESEKGIGSTFYFTLNTEEGRGKVEEKTPASYS